MGVCFLGLLCLYGAIHVVYVMAPLTTRLMDAGLSFGSLGFVTLGSAVCLTTLLLCTISGAFLYFGIARQARLNHQTCYLITNQRVLLSRGFQEIHLDRRNVVDLLERNRDGLSCDAYLVMDGPGSRALGANGAFGPSERVEGFLPVLRGVEDIDGLRQALGMQEAQNKQSSLRKKDQAQPA
jgi:hypothetical protein